MIINQLCQQSVHEDRVCVFVVVVVVGGGGGVLGCWFLTNKQTL